MNVGVGTGIAVGTGVGVGLGVGAGAGTDVAVGAGGATFKSSDTDLFPAVSRSPPKYQVRSPITTKDPGWLGNILMLIDCCSPGDIW